MKSPYRTLHWITLAAVAAAALLTLSEAWGQSTGAAAVFEGRPAVSGAQAGQGAMAGPPQGGISPQGMDGQRRLDLRRPSGLDSGMPAVPRDPGVSPAPGGDHALAPQRDRDPGNVTRQNRVSGKAKKAVKRTVQRSRHGTSGVDD